MTIIAIIAFIVLSCSTLMDSSVTGLPRYRRQIISGSRCQVMMTDTGLIAAINTEIRRSTSDPEYSGRIANNIGTGGSGASAFIVRDDTTNVEYFVKQAGIDGFDMLKCEYEGMKEIFNTNTIRVPKPICVGTFDYTSFVVFEKLSLGGLSRPELGGRKLAELHSVQSDSGNRNFGWDFTNTIGATSQPNAWNENWADFWDSQRLGHMLKVIITFLPLYFSSSPPSYLFLSKLCKAEGATFPEEKELREKVRKILESHKVSPSLVHGDLWAGNFGWTTSGEPVIYDPAFYYGDR